MTRLPLAAALIVALVAAACAEAAGPAVSQPEPAPGTSGAPSVTSDPDGSPSADIGRLNVSRQGWATDFTRASVDLAEIQSGGPPKDGIPAVDAPVFESIDAARTWLGPVAPVIALERNGEARAYPLAILVWHEIVNDTLGGVPVVVTFCPLCHTALVFERTLDGTVHDFGTTGNLRFSDLVMYDRQTESWWQQATGQAIVGSLTGARLTFVPAQIVSLDDFAAAWPDGTVLSRDTGSSRDYGRNPYPGYDNADERPFLYVGELDGRLAPKERVVTIEVGEARLAIPLSALAERGAIQVDVGGRQLVALWEPGTASALDAALVDGGRDAGATGVFVPEVDGVPITLRRDGGRDAPILDAETGSTWSVTGHATAGPNAGSQLEPVVHGDHFWFAWAAFQPDTEVWSP